MVKHDHSLTGVIRRQPTSNSGTIEKHQHEGEARSLNDLPIFSIKSFLKRKKSNNLTSRLYIIGKVTTLAGSGKPGHADGEKKNAKFDGPFGLCFHELTQSLIVCDF